MSKRGWLRGTSLVEVLVVMVVLLIGILAFVRLFPGGFFIIQQSGQAGSATRLAELELERLKARSDALPYAIEPIRYDNGRLLIDPDLPPDEFGTQPGVPNNQIPFFSGVNRFRQVIGERINIPLPGPVRAQQLLALERGSVYLTTFAPIVEEPPGQEGQLLRVYGNPLRRRLAEYPDGTPFLQPFEYGIDYDEGQILLRRFRFRIRPIQYRVEFAYWKQAQGGSVELAQITLVVDVEPPQSPDDPPVVWKDLGDLTGDPGFISIVPESDWVARMFDRLQPTASWTPEYPYEYKVLSAQLGLLDFHPNAAGFYERYWGGQRPLTANVDYIVRDWQIIREERAMPDNGVIKLTFNNLKRTGDLLNDQTTYSGLGIVDADPGFRLDGTEDLLLISTETGRVVRFKSGQPPKIGTTDLSGHLSLDYRFGVVNINLSNPDFLAAYPDFRNFRILYRVHDDWAMSVQKAPERFIIAPAPALMVSYNYCYIGGSYQGEGSPTKLYFRASEAGKTIVLREYWYEDSEGRIKRGTNGVFKISQPGSSPFSGVSFPVASIDLRERHSDAVAWSPVQTGIAVRGVQGVSVKVRLTWQPAGQRLRKMDFDTLLVRED